MHKRSLGIARRVIGMSAIAAASILFWDVSRKFLEFADRHCGEAEAGGNCRSLQSLIVESSTSFFVAAMVVLAFVILLPHPKPRVE